MPVPDRARAVGIDLRVPVIPFSVDPFSPPVAPFAGKGRRSLPDPGGAATEPLGPSEPRSSHEAPASAQKNLPAQSEPAGIFVIEWLVGDRSMVVANEVRSTASHAGRHSSSADVSREKPAT